MGFISFLQSIETAKDTTEVAKNAVSTARHISETIRDVTQAAVDITENFTQAKITETFMESLPEVKDAGEGRLEVATMKNVKTFKRTDRLTILWDTVSLGTRSRSSIFSISISLAVVSAVCAPKYVRRSP